MSFSSRYPKVRQNFFLFYQTKRLKNTEPLFSFVIFHVLTNPMKVMVAFSCIPVEKRGELAYYFEFTRTAKIIDLIFQIFQ